MAGFRECSHLRDRLVSQKLISIDVYGPTGASQECTDAPMSDHHHGRETYALRPGYRL